MPKFPTSLEALPPALRFFNPYHHLLLAYWIYFRPTTLKCYFHQALPELYSADAQPGFFQRWGLPAYRNVYLMLPITTLLLALLLSLPVVLLTSWRLQVPLKWNGWWDGLSFGLALGVMLGMAFGMVGRVLGGAALGSLFGVAFGITIGVVGSLTLSVALGVAYSSVMDGVVIVGAIFGIAGAMAFTLDIEIAVALSLAFAMMGGLSLFAELLAFKTLGMRFGALLARGVMSGAFVFGAFRLLLYPFQCGLACGSVFSNYVRHPIEWDELTILPLPFTRRTLLRQLHSDEQAGLRLLNQVGRNLFRRQVLQSTLSHYLHSHPDPIGFLYALLTNPNLDEYLLVPVSTQHWQHYVSVRQVFLGELGLRPVEATQQPRFHRSSWWLNLRKRHATPLTNFAGMLSELLEEHVIEDNTFDLHAYHDVYSALANSPHGREITYSYQTMTSFLTVSTIADLADAEATGRRLALNIFFRDALRPNVLQVLARLGHVGASIADSQQATERNRQFTLFARAARELNELHDLIQQTVMAPERLLLHRIIMQWQRLILEAIGALGQNGNLSHSPHDSER